MYRELNQPRPSSAFGPSERLRIRTGLLARTREDTAAARDAREPDELFAHLDMSLTEPSQPPRRPA